MILVQIAIIVLVLSFLVLIHELGHYIAAKLVKINVEEFGLGYPPRAAVLFKKWDTIFSLNWIPFGGFVKMEGEDEVDDDSEHEDRDESKKHQDKKVHTNSVGPFYEKNALQRLFVILAGAAVNFLFGILAFGIVFSFIGIPISDPRISQVVEGSPAATAGIPANVNIKSIIIGDQVIDVTSTDQVINTIYQYRGQSITLITTGLCQGFNCQSETHDYQVYVRTEQETPQNQGAIGVVFDPVIFYPWYEMPIRGMIFGTVQAMQLGVLLLQFLGKMMIDLVAHQVVPQEVSGPVGIVYHTHKQGILDGGPLAVLNFAGMLSINLAIMNVLPIPALDGGRAVFIMLEKITGKKRIKRVESYLHYGGFVLLMGLLILVTIKDIVMVVKN